MKLLTEQEHELVVKWLDSKHYGSCPFGIISYPYCCHVLCTKLFPDLENRRIDGKYHCPCHCYSIKYVLRVVKKLLNERKRYDIIGIGNSSLGFKVV